MHLCQAASNVLRNPICTLDSIMRKTKWPALSKAGATCTLDKTKGKTLFV